MSASLAPSPPKPAPPSPKPAPPAQPMPPPPPAHPCQAVNAKFGGGDRGKYQQACNAVPDGACFFQFLTADRYSCVPASQGREGPEKSAGLPRLPGPPGAVIPDLYPDSLLFLPSLEGIPEANADWCVSRCRHQLAGKRAAPAAVRECANVCAQKIAAAADEPFFPSSAQNFQW